MKQTRFRVEYCRVGMVSLNGAIPPPPTIRVHRQRTVVVIPEGSNLWFILCHALFCTVGMYLLHINFSFYLGIALILLSVFLQSMKAWRK